MNIFVKPYTALCNWLCKIGSDDTAERTGYCTHDWWPEQRVCCGRWNLDDMRIRRFLKHSASLQKHDTPDTLDRVKWCNQASPHISWRAGNWDTSDNWRAWSNIVYTVHAHCTYPWYLHIEPEASQNHYWVFRCSQKPITTMCSNINKNQSHVLRYK